MDFPPNYKVALTNTRITRHFPNLTDGNFTFSSLKNEDYNCVAWTLSIKDERIQFKDEFGNLDVNLQTYINYYSNLGFSVTGNNQFEPNKTKIAIYYLDAVKEFKHVAFQLPDGRWASKVGDWEDIEHDLLEVLLGNSYGNAILYMEKALI